MTKQRKKTRHKERNGKLRERLCTKEREIDSEIQGDRKERQRQ